MKPILLRTGAQETRWFVRLLAGLAVFAMAAALGSAVQGAFGVGD